MDFFEKINRDLLILSISYLEIDEQKKILQINKSIDCVYPTVYTFPQDCIQLGDWKYSKQYVQKLIVLRTILPSDDRPVDYRLFPNLRHLQMVETMHLRLPHHLKELTLTSICIPIVDLRTTNLIKLSVISCSKLHLELPISLKVISLFNNLNIDPHVAFRDGLIEINITDWNYDRSDTCYTLPLSLERLQIESSTITEINIPTGSALEYLNCSWCPEIVSLVDLPPSLSEINCAYSYRLKNIDLTGVLRLTSLNCSGCPINQLNLPHTLEKLYCYECLGLVICKLPFGLKELWLDGNQTKAIDLKRLPDGLTDLILYGTNLNLTCPKGLKRLWCSQHTLTTLDRTTGGEIEIELLGSREKSYTEGTEGDSSMDDCYY